MKRRVYFAAALLGASAAALLGCAILYVWGAFPVRRHPYAYPFSIVCGGIAAVFVLAAVPLLIYYITKLPRGARLRTIFCCVPVTALCFVAGFFLFECGYDTAAEIVHQVDAREDMMLADLLLNLLFFCILISPVLCAVSLTVGVLLLRRGNRLKRRTWLGMLLLPASGGFAWLWNAYLLGGLIGRLVFWGIVLLIAWLIYRHLRQTADTAP